MLTVTEAVRRRISVRAFKPDPVPGDLLRDLLEVAHRAPSGGNLQPWRVYALAGEPLAAFKADVAAKMKANPRGEGAEYDVYPKELVDPYRGRRFQVGEDMYGTMGVTREDRAARRWACSSASTAAWGRRSGPTSACSCRPSCCWRWSAGSTPALRRPGPCGTRRCGSTSGCPTS